MLDRFKLKIHQQNQYIESLIKMSWVYLPNIQHFNEYEYDETGTKNYKYEVTAIFLISVTYIPRYRTNFLNRHRRN